MKAYPIQEQSAHFITCTLVGLSMLAELSQSIDHRKGYTSRVHNLQAAAVDICR